MKGLLIKDLCLLRGQKRILPVFLILTVWFTVMFRDGFALPRTISGAMKRGVP